MGALEQYAIELKGEFGFNDELQSLRSRECGRLVAGTVGWISSVDGWKTVIVRPEPGGKLYHTEVTFDGPYGMVSCRRSASSDIFTMELVIPPPNSKAVVTLPSTGSKRIEFGSGKHSFASQYVTGKWPRISSPVFW